jgi:hypothetical protein
MAWNSDVQPPFCRATRKPFSDNLADFSSPLEFTRKELLPLLPNARLVVLDELGHDDITANQPEAFRRLMEEFFSRGNVDRSLFKPAPMDFRVAKPLGSVRR